MEICVWLRELKLGLCDNLKGWKEWEAGGRLKKEVIMTNSYDVWQKSNQYCKAIILQLKINLKNIISSQVNDSLNLCENYF